MATPMRIDRCKGCGEYIDIASDHKPGCAREAMNDPVLTWFDCSLCPHSFHIAAAHRDAVEAHHRKRVHAGDVNAVLVEGVLNTACPENPRP